MAIPDFTNDAVFPVFDALPVEDDAESAGPDARPEWFLVAQVKQNMTITKPTVVVSDRGGDEFAITFEDRGIDLRPVKTGWTIVVPRAVRTKPKEGKKGFVRVAEGKGTAVKYVPADLDKVVELGTRLRADNDGAGQKCASCGGGAEGTLKACTGCGAVKYCGKVSFVSTPFAVCVCFVVRVRVV
ncbi:zinc finger, mynd-type domain containing protein [Colletotrichum truncatum]|uniref:Zinc finger, mynd-type domain containing protein n=1 Tax=Colletotrichum truncatum TaxID=5467 RepID=A0ACC3ZF50_COLTU